MSSKDSFIRRAKKYILQQCEVSGGGDGSALIAEKIKKKKFLFKSTTSGCI